MRAETYPPVKTIVTPDTLMRWQCVQIRQACSVGDNPTEERVRPLVAWVTSLEETNAMKVTDKAIHGIVSESPGRNVSELIGGLVT